MVAFYIPTSDGTIGTIIECKSHPGENTFCTTPMNTVSDDMGRNYDDIEPLLCTADDYWLAPEQGHL